MHPEESGETESALELPSRLNELLNRVDETSATVQSVVLDHIHDPRDPDILETAFVGHAFALRVLLTHLFDETEGYQTEEAAAIAAHVLKSDDTERVDFLAQLSGEEGSNTFHYGYPDNKGEISERISWLADHIREEYDFPEDFVRELMNQHATFMQADINMFLQTDFIQKRIAAINKREEFREKAVAFVTTAAAAAIGTLVAKAIWNKKER